MSIERRIGKRRPTHMAVELSQSGKTIGTTVATNVSAGGLAIDNLGSQFRFGNMLEVTLLDSRSEFDQSQRFHALVIHTSKNSTGLMFVRQSE